MNEPLDVGPIKAKLANAEKSDLDSDLFQAVRSGEMCRMYCRDVSALVAEVERLRTAMAGLLGLADNSRIMGMRASFDQRAVDAAAMLPSRERLEG